MMAERMNRLGTETAFAVSEEAAKLAAGGRKIYSFHLGDINIKTPENIIEAAKRAMDSGKTGYAPTAGIRELRDAIAGDVAGSRKIGLTAENVSVQPGGKPVIGKFILSLMNPGDEVLYPNPGYPIYESMIKFHAGIPKPYRLHETKDGLEIRTGEIESMITKKTRLLIYNNYHNPTSAESSTNEMEELARIAVKHNLWVLSDEAYFDIVYSGKGRSIVSYPGMPERTVILYTFSKRFAMTGWRLGAAIGPAEIIRMINKLNVNDESCTNHFVQYAGIEAIKGDQSGSRKLLKILEERRDAAVSSLRKMEGIKVHLPNSTFYLFPNVTGAMKRMGIKDVEEFRKLMLEKTGVSFCTRNHFGTPLPDEREFYIRLAYSGIERDNITEGLGIMREFIESH